MHKGRASIRELDFRVHEAAAGAYRGRNTVHKGRASVRRLVSTVYETAARTYRDRNTVHKGRAGIRALFLQRETSRVATSGEPGAGIAGLASASGDGLVPIDVPVRPV